ncbi:11831_t:CDS:1 [Acaulospora morrowiae]|uniref:11831_t:CDS:1 n=1 Tax=Acaulospora morrowiae TaxID=94023 RepID=A0A9N9F2X9_9GLOM|nr:11831_t:CDS:1 [Acaulospora morrowiae]
MILFIIFSTVLLITLTYKLRSNFKLTASNKETIPISVNFHFTRNCNYECGFCFHTAKNSAMPTLESSKVVLQKLSNAGMKKLNFAGGEPFLYPKYLQHLLRYSKQVLHLESVSIVSNGSKITKKFLDENKDYIDILAISCDSFDESTNIKIGRGKGNHVEKLKELSRWCKEYNIKFKLNTVVNKFNYFQDMNKHIEMIQPFRWKCFQVLIIDNENGGENTLRDARDFVISDQEYDDFVKRHRRQKCMVVEGNKVMRNSYLILDENLCFLNCQGNDKRPTECLTNVDVSKALIQAGWDQNSFSKRSGVYDWSKSSKPSCGGDNSKLLDW